MKLYDWNKHKQWVERNYPVIHKIFSAGGYEQFKQIGLQLKEKLSTKDKESD